MMFTGWFVTAVALGLMAVALFIAELRIHRCRQHCIAEMAALKASDQLFRNALDALAQGVLIQKPDGVVVYVNPAALELTERLGKKAHAEPGQLPLNGFDEIVDESGRAVSDDDLPRGRVLATGQPVTDLIFGARSGSATQWLNCNAAPIDDASDDGAIVVSIVDVTNERRLMTQLAAEERRFRKALRYAPIGMALVTWKGDFTQANDAFCEIVGRSQQEVLAGSFRDVLHPDDVRFVAGRGVHLLEGGPESYRREGRYVRPSGEIIDCLTAVAVVQPDDGDDHEPYFILQVVDIRERKQVETAQALALEREREAVAGLQELNRSKTDFVSTVSHELRTPLASVMGYLELLSDDPDGRLAPDQQKMVKIATQNGKRLWSLIEDLLTLSVAESRPVELTLTTIDVRDLVQRVVDELMSCARLHSAALIANVSPEVTTLTGDAQRVEQMLIHLVANAIKFIPRNGTVRIDVASVPSPHSAEGERDHVEFRVSDNGDGISDEDQLQLFTRFFRTESARVRAIPGAGLGLSVVSEIVNAHGGDVKIESQLGVGTTAIVSLPQHDLAPQLATSHR